MKTLRTFIKERTLVPFNGFVIGRNQMPQIEYIDDFINFVDMQHIDCTKTSGTVGHLNPTQFEYDELKVKRIMDEFVEDNKMKPIIVSDDGYVLDGHHRYFAAKELNVAIPYILIRLPINKLLKLAYNYMELKYDGHNNKEGK